MKGYRLFIVLALVALIIIAVGGYYLDLAIRTRSDGNALTAGPFLIATGVGIIVIVIAAVRMYRLSLREIEEVTE